jgi:Ca2+-binding EF-hand superfamily protein
LNLLNSLQLRLSLLEVKNLREQIDADASGTISRDEFVAHAPGLIRLLGIDQEEGPGDWCKIEHGDECWWYNKRSGEAHTVKPFELEQEETAEPRIDDFMARQFRLVDSEASGVVEMEQFAQLITSLQLGLSADQMQALQLRLDAAIKGTQIAWADFIQHVPICIAGIYEAKMEQSATDWSEVPTRDGRSFWYNKRNRVSQYDIPQVSVTMQALIFLP